MYSCRYFTNEIGNRIEIDVRTEPGSPVEIRMTGPASASTNIITPREAAELYWALRDIVERADLLKLANDH